MLCELLKGLVETQIERHARRKREDQRSLGGVARDYEESLDGLEAV
jgi:hypothetical protein